MAGQGVYIHVELVQFVRLTKFKLDSNEFSLLLRSIIFESALSSEVVSKYRDYEFSDRKFWDRKSSDFPRIFFSVTENLVTTSMVSNMSERNFSD